MKHTARPSYYKEFQCIASRCTDSCCIGWEIDIDEDTLEYYRTVGGAFGQRLKEHIVWNTEEDQELPHFLQGERERCPFLNSCNLCDIFIQLGEEHLSQICTHHPRFYDWYSDWEEGGLGLCCEEAARLILTCQEPFALEVEYSEEHDPENEISEYETLEYETSGDEISEIEISEIETSENDTLENVTKLYEDEDLLFEEEVLTCLTEGREALFQIIRKADRCVSGTDRMTDEIWKKAGELQDRLDDLIYGEAEEDPEADAEEQISSFSDWFWEEQNLRELLAFLKKLEINDTAWWKRLLELEQNLPDLLRMKQENGTYPEGRQEDVARLLFYFLYRHFMKAREEAEVQSYVAFALGSCHFLWLLDLLILRKKGSLSLRDQIEAAKLYSKEIEYDEENTVSLAEYFCSQALSVRYGD